MRVQCCQCLKMKNGDTWEPWPYREDVSHTYCPPCAEIMRKQIEKHRPKKGDDNGR